MSNIVVFGENGMLGSYMVKYLSNCHNVTPINRQQIDARTPDTKTLKDIVLNSDVVVNCVGLIKQRNVDANDMYKVNSVFPKILEALCICYDKEFIHITTDCVFNGSVGMYNEESVMDASDDYGVSKILGEPLHKTVIRTSIIGEETRNRRSLLEWVKSNKEQSIDGYTNHFWSGVTCLQLCKVVRDIIDNNKYWAGVRILNTAKISKFELVSIINDVYELNIKIAPIESTFCDRTMISDFSYPNSIMTENIKEQIEEQKLFLIQRQ